MQHNSTTGRYVTNVPGEQVQCNATVQHYGHFQVKTQVQRNATQHNSAMGRYMRNALEEQVQHNAMQPCNSNDILELKPKCNAMQCNKTVQREDMSEML